MFRIHKTIKDFEKNMEFQQSGYKQKNKQQFFKI